MIHHSPWFHRPIQQTAQGDNRHPEQIPLIIR